MFDIIVIGGGATGMTSALYALRSGKSVLVLEKETFGGQIATSPRVENYPSLKSISGLDFSSNLFDQIIELGASFELEEVLSISKVNKTFKVVTNYNEYEAKAVILASGVKHRTLNLPHEEDLIGHGISYCATCDGAFYKDQDVVIVGDANTALQYALELSNLCRSVTIVTLFDKFFGEEVLIKQVTSRPNVTYFHNYELKEYLGGGEVSGLRFVNTINGHEKIINTSGVFVAIGQVPDNSRFKDLVDLDKGYILTNDKMETKTAGLYAAGDCRLKVIRQLTTAVNDGTIAAINAAIYIDKNF